MKTPAFRYQDGQWWTPGVIVLLGSLGLLGLSCSHHQIVERHETVNERVVEVAEPVEPATETVPEEGENLVGVVYESEPAIPEEDTVVESTQVDPYVEIPGDEQFEDSQPVVEVYDEWEKAPGEPEVYVYDPYDYTVYETEVPEVVYYETEEPVTIYQPVEYVYEYRTVPEVTYVYEDYPAWVGYRCVDYCDDFSWSFSIGYTSSSWYCTRPWFHYSHWYYRPTWSYCYRPYWSTWWGVSWWHYDDWGWDYHYSHRHCHAGRPYHRRDHWYDDRGWHRREYDYYDDDARYDDRKPYRKDRGPVPKSELRGERPEIARVEGPPNDRTGRKADGPVRDERPLITGRDRPERIPSRKESPRSVVATDRKPDVSRDLRDGNRPERKTSPRVTSRDSVQSERVPASVETRTGRSKSRVSRTERPRTDNRITANRVSPTRSERSDVERLSQQERPTVSAGDQTRALRVPRSDSREERPKVDARTLFRTGDRTREERSPTVRETRPSVGTTRNRVTDYDPPTVSSRGPRIVITSKNPSNDRKTVSPTIVRGSRTADPNRSRARIIQAPPSTSEPRIIRPPSRPARAPRVEAPSRTRSSSRAPVVVPPSSSGNSRSQVRPSSPSRSEPRSVSKPSISRPQPRSSRPSAPSRSVTGPSASRSADRSSAPSRGSSRAPETPSRSSSGGRGPSRGRR